MQEAIMSETVNVKSKTEFYNTDRILSKWGFTGNQCFNCGVLNSDLNGLLMQCGKCKKAYYCGMKVRDKREAPRALISRTEHSLLTQVLLCQCFNAHLPVHQKFCGTKEITCEPKGQHREPFDFEKSGRITKPVKDDVPSEKEEPAEPSEDESTDGEIVELAVEAVDHQTRLDYLGLLNSKEHENLSQSFSEFGRGTPRYIPERDEWVMEEVDLRHAELMKREYGWLSPDWVDAHLRPTPHGKVLKQNGDIVHPVTNAKILIEKGIISWQAPDWTNAKLRKTARGEAIKRECLPNSKQATTTNTPDGGQKTSCNRRSKSAPRSADR